MHDHRALHRLMSLFLVFTLIFSALPVSALTPAVPAEAGRYEAPPGLVTAFEVLAKEIRFQRDYAPVLPETVTATVDGIGREIPVT